MGKFVIKTDRAGKFRFNFNPLNGQVIGTSEMHSSEPAM